MKYLYTEKDLDIISWERIDEYIDKIYLDVDKYIKKNGLKIRYISPILRGGGIPAVKLSHLFDQVDMLPIQLKNNLKTKKIDIKINLDYVKNSELNENEAILLVEGNHVTGRTANIATNMLINKFGESTKIIYVSLTRDYTYRYSVKNTIYTTWARTTNETKELSEDECNKLNIDYKLVSVYPWENVKEELEELNNE
ncbi:MAG: hypothetical protein ACI4VH_03745 [Clostridia bacterium]